MPSPARLDRAVRRTPAPAERAGGPACRPRTPPARRRGQSVLRGDAPHVMGAFLLWLFSRHRDRYRPVRQVMAWTTSGACSSSFCRSRHRACCRASSTPACYTTSRSTATACRSISSRRCRRCTWPGQSSSATTPFGSARAGGAGSGRRIGLTILVVVATGNHWWLDGSWRCGAIGLCVGVAGVRHIWPTVRPVPASRPLATVAAGAVLEH